MIVKLNDLPKLRKKFKGKTIVFAGGTFDLFHATHVKVFKDLKSRGDVLVIGISSDREVKIRKGLKRPILTQAERGEIIDAIRYVDFTLPMPSSSKSKPVDILVMEKLRPDTFFTIDKKRWLDFKSVITDLGVKLVIRKRIHPTSSTDIINRVLQRHKVKN